jgi:hypothetical protein
VPNLTQLATLIASLAAASGVIYQARKSRREDVSSMIEVNEATVVGLKEQNRLLQQQLDDAKAAYARREQEWQAREAEWREERLELRRRLEHVEQSYRELVLSVTKSGICALADDCGDYTPGDRRAEVSPGGTD